MYKTQDLYLAAYLKSIGKDISGTERRGKIVYFIFDGVEDSDITDFYNDAHIGATTYKDAINNLKTMIFHGGE